jgi:hypothetical protein
MGAENRPGDAVNPAAEDPHREVPIDERDSISPEDEAEHERWLRENRPPHHG